MDEQKRRCPKCKKDFPLTAEYFHRNGEDFVYYCKPCRSEMQKGYKLKEKIDSPPAKKKHRAVISSAPLKPMITTATPEEIISALRKGVAEEIIQMVRGRFGL